MVAPLDSVRIHGRTYSYHSGNTGATMVAIDDGATPFLAYLVRTFPDELTKALGHVGWWMRRKIQDAAYKENPAGTHWPELSDIHRLRTLEDLKRERVGKSLRAPATHAFGQLVKAVGYKRDKAMMRVRIGWLSRAAAAKANKLQEGFTTEVTPEMRRFFAAAGLGIPQGNVIRTEGRELIRPVFESSRKEILQRIEMKVDSYLSRSERKFKRAA